MNEHEHFCVKKVPIFQNLSHEKLKKINALVNKKTYTQGELIYLQGDIGKNLYILESGQAKIYKTGKQGREYILHLLKEGQFFGELVLFKDEKLSTNAQAITDCMICTIRKEELEKVIKKDIEIAQSIIKALSSRLKKAENMIESLALEDARDKTIRLLQELALQDGLQKEGKIKIELPLPRKSLAKLMGITQETLSRKLNDLEQSGFIERHGTKELIIDQKLFR